MTVELPTEKKLRLRSEIRKFRVNQEYKIRDFAKLVGTLVSYCPAVKYGMVYTKAYKRAKYLALRENNDDYEGLIAITRDVMDELEWWRATDHLYDKQILLRVDNTTAISYINRMGGVQFEKLNRLSKNLWKWCEQRNLWIFASYIPPEMNYEADTESRKLESNTEFKLSRGAFEKLSALYGRPDIDLFASRECVKILEEPYPDCRSLVRMSFEMKEVPKDSMKILLASLSDSSWKQYDSALRKSWSFCQTRKISPYSNSVPDVLTFLTEAFEKGGSQGTLNSYRSAISLLVGPELAQDFRLKRFFKAMSRLRASRPKYSSTWDPKMVLDYLVTLLPNEKMNLRDLSLKLIILLALTTGHRMQTFSLIKLENIQRESNAIEINIPAHIKISSKNRNQPVLVFPFYSANVIVCVASAMECYTRTVSIRGLVSSLFVSFKKPFGAVGAQSLSRWIKEVLGKSGLDTDIFTAYSTRHASTSAAKRKGLDLDTLRRTGDWTVNSQTFAKFYDLPLLNPTDSFANTILND
ncbi:uncharacterized protein LOC128884526 [Hylaeus volcanicus]|uniref:uncharacterized protein LOC128884526 n=1 Tax=Hylaeus volcanicus TaxID=313075 RepID=UPI0023B7DE93|nr:uncharacterized protein LOC128884526 [Hylaeus volcanicus]